MTNEYRIAASAIRSGLAPQSVEALRPEFPRWIRHLCRNGVVEIPDSPLTADGHASNLLSLLIRQGSDIRDSAVEHNLRDMTRTRPYKGRADGRASRERSDTLSRHVIRKLASIPT